MYALRRAAVTVMLAAAYVLILLPVGLVARVIRDPLRRSRSTSAPTYFTEVRTTRDRAPG